MENNFKVLEFNDKADRRDRPCVWAPARGVARGAKLGKIQGGGCIFDKGGVTIFL